MNLDLERRVGLAPIRVWGLIVNFLANAVLLYGAAGYLADGSRLPLVVLGAAVTSLAIVTLARPVR